MAEHTIVGELISAGAERDAIHIAVAPVVAATDLMAGEHIGFINSDNTSEVRSCEPAMSVGIVDPFLNKPVRPGDRFWMFLHPNTITSLRHNWTHPAFSGAPQEEETLQRNFSKEWMRNFANNYGVSYPDMLEAGKSWVQGGHYYCDGGTFEGERVPDEYWVHFQIITNTTVDDDKKQSFFTCSC